MSYQIQLAVMIGLHVAIAVESSACLPPLSGEKCGAGLCSDGELCVPVGEDVSVQQSICAVPNVCGNGIQDVGEQCDDSNTADGDACEANCTLPVCGNGIVDVGEQCDDSNTTEFDGCGLTCRLETVELEPNDAGRHSITGNDFSTMNANGPFTGSVTIRAAISPAGDEDVFRFTNQRAYGMIMQFDTWSQALGIGVPCERSTHTLLYIRDAIGMSLTPSNNREGDFCSTVTYTMRAGATVYVHVLQYDDNMEIPGYILLARYLRPADDDPIFMPL